MNTNTSSLTLGSRHSRSLRMALRDIREGIQARDLWMTFAWNDVMARYRRSRLGQFWITVSIGVFVAAIGLFYSQVLSVPVANYLPFLTIGYVAWSYIAAVTSEGASVFISAAGFLTQHRIPLTAFVLRCVQRNLYILGHNLFVVIIVLFIYPPAFDLSLLLLIPAALLWYFTAIWVVLLLGLISTRFRDMPQVISSVMQILFLLTPVLWSPDLLKGEARWVALFNPFSHYLAIFRDPLLGQTPPFVSFIVATAVTLAGGALTVALFARVRSRIPYWL